MIRMKPPWTGLSVLPAVFCLAQGADLDNRGRAKSVPDFAVVLLAAGFLTGTGSAEELWCRSLGADQGLSQSFVAAIAQDHDGFMWFGT
jgi:hypothetical protein